MRALSPLQAARDQTIIAACLAAAMASGGETFTSAPDRAGDAPPLSGPRAEMVERARAMRADARSQCEAARAMRRENDGIARGLRNVSRS